MKNLVLAKNEKKDYTLLAQLKEDFTVSQYVVAWKYDSTTDTWGQGHYFQADTLDLAMEYMYLDNLVMTIVCVMRRLDDVVDESTDFRDIELDDLKSHILDGLLCTSDYLNGDEI